MSVELPATKPIAFDYAKQALAYIGAFQTPPTPKVYEVWYRYVEGSNASIAQQLDHAVKEAKEVPTELLECLHDQFCTTSDELNERVSLELTAELTKLQALVANQMHAGDDFSNSIDSANRAVSPPCERPSDIAARIKVLLQTNETMQSQLQEMGSQLEESQSQVESLRRDLVDSRQSMMTDPLTGVGNRRFFDSLIQTMVASAPLSDRLQMLLLLDLDEFKEINDLFGHAAGDQVLRFVATETSKLRPDASIARYGGDEFAVFLETRDVKEATELADQIRRYFSVNQLHQTRTGESLGRIRLSIGVAILRPDDDVESWFDRADRLLYKAKESGRNCVMVERSQER